MTYEVASVFLLWSMYLSHFSLSVDQRPFLVLFFCRNTWLHWPMVPDNALSFLGRSRRDMNAGEMGLSHRNLLMGKN